MEDSLLEFLSKFLEDSLKKKSQINIKCKEGFLDKSLEYFIENFLEETLDESLEHSFPNFVSRTPNCMQACFDCSAKSEVTTD